MAKAISKMIKTEREETTGIELSLTQKEAQVLLAVLGHIGGTGHGREQTIDMYDALSCKVGRDQELKFNGYWYLDEN